MIMRLKANRLILMALIASTVLLWRERIDRDIVSAQGPKPVMVTRIYTGADGLAHAEDIELKLNGRGVSEMMKATGVEVSRRPPSTTPGDWHTGPARQLVITLSGRSEVEVAGGVKVASGPGHINLIEDTTGKGHITRNFGPDDRVVLTIPLADGQVVEGVRTARTGNQ
jgi:hypothetical protein